MKISSSYLFDLVSKLSKSEKRYIKVQAGSKAKDYIHLFDALIAQKAFDEGKLLKDYASANFVKHLSVNKRYLYELILNSLTRFGQKSFEDKIYEKISAANVLIEKGMFLAAYNELSKGKKIAKKYEFYDLLLMLLKIEKKIIIDLKRRKANLNIHEIYTNELECLDQIKNTNEYWYLFQQIAEFQKSYQKIQNEDQQKQIERLTQSPFFDNISLASNFRSRLYFYQTKAAYQFTLGQVKEAYHYNAKFLNSLEENPHFLQIYAERYLATLNNMLIDSFIIGKFDILEEGIKRLAETVNRSEFKSIKNLESRVFRQRYLLLINWSLRQKDYKKSLDLIPEIEKGLNQFGKKIEKHHRITFYYLVAYLLFLNQKFEDALHWNNYIMFEPKEDVVKEIFYFARILNIVIHYELKHYNLLESLLLSTPKYLKARRPLFITEKMLFRYLRKDINSINKKEKLELKNEFRSELKNLSEMTSEKRVFNYLDLRIWMKNK